METDEEQVEKLKAWLKENGLSIVLGIIIGVGGIGGYNYWNQMQDTAAVQASGHFTRMISALEAGNADELRREADILVRDYGSTDYALMAHLALARQYVEDDAFDQAEQSLQQVVGSAAQKPLAYVARIRLAAVQLEQERYDQTLSTLAAEFPQEFQARVDELRGDAYARQGKVSEAIAAYRKAQSAAPGPANADFLQQKLDDLGARG